MQPRIFSSLWSFSTEFKFVLLAFLTVLMVPVIGVVLLTKIGLNIISDTLVEANPMTNTIEIKDLLTGEVVTSIAPMVVWPVDGTITLEFGESSLYQVFHSGIDIASFLGDPIRPAMDGTVMYAGEISWGYGKHVIIDHGNNVTTTYAHLDKIYVYTGQEVTLNDTIGTQGNTGWSTGPHLHFETRIYGIPVNPREFLKT